MIRFGVRPWTLLALSLLATVGIAQLHLDFGLASFLPNDNPSGWAMRRAMGSAVWNSQVLFLLEAPDPSSLKKAEKILHEELQGSRQFARVLTLGEESSLKSLREESADLAGNLPRIFSLLPLLPEPDRSQALQRLTPEGMRHSLRETFALLSLASEPELRGYLQRDPLRLGELVRPLFTSLGKAAVDHRPLAPPKDSAAATRLFVAHLDKSEPPAKQHRDADLLQSLNSVRQVLEKSVPGVTLGTTGLPVFAAEDAKVIRSDLRATMIGTVAAVILLGILLFGSAIEMMLALTPLALGLFWTLGLIGFLFGSVSGLATTFAAILIGLGVDYAIHLETQIRALEEKSPARSDTPLWQTLWKEKGPLLLGCAASTSFAFLSLCLLDLPAFRQLGFSVGIGLPVTLFAYVLWAPFHVELGLTSRRAHRSYAVTWPWAARLLSHLSRRGVLYLLAASSLAAAALVLLHRDELRLRGLGEFRPRHSQAAKTEERLRTLFPSETQVHLVLAYNSETPLPQEELQHLQTKIASANGRAPLLTTLLATSSNHWKDGFSSAVWNQAAANLPAALSKTGFSPAAFPQAAAILQNTGMTLAETEGPPQLFRSIFSSEHAGEITWVLPVALPETSKSLVLTETIEPTAHLRWAIASGSRVEQTLVETLRHQLPNALTLALAAVLGIALWLLGTLPLLLRLTLLFALALLGTIAILLMLGVSFHPLTVAAFPVVLGIALDNFLFVGRAYRDANTSGNASDPMPHLLPAVLLTSGTTLLGFGSLAFARYPALADFGLSVSIGLLVFVASVLVFWPAFLNRTSQSSDTPSSWIAWDENPFAQPFWQSFLAGGIRILPRFLSQWIARGLCFAFLFLLPAQRRAAQTNLRVVLGPAGPLTDWHRAYQVFFQWGLTIIEAFRVHFGLPLKISLLADGRDYIDQSLAEGRGCVIVTCHLGSWHVAGKVLEDAGYSLTIVMRGEPNPRTRQALEKSAAKRRIRFLYVGEGPDAMIQVLHALKRNEIVAFQGDRVFESPDGRKERGERAVPVTFFGRETQFPSGPALLSLLSGAPLVPAVAVRLGPVPDNRYKVYCRGLIRPPPHAVDRSERNRELKRLTQEYAAHLEAMVREEPYQWFNFHRVWPSPEDSPSESAPLLKV